MNANPLWAWMNERHAIYLRRQAGDPWPWTTDPVLQQFRFCNVYRELDTVTIWIRQHIREPNADNPHLWFLLCAARVFNQPATLQAAQGAGALPLWAGGTYEPDALLAVLGAQRAAGVRRYGAAYMMSGTGAADPVVQQGKPADASAKDWMYTHAVLLRLWAARAEAARVLAQGSTEAWCRWLAAQYGFGGFLAYEVACDLHYTAALCDAPDRDTWAHAGPGATRGLNRLLGRPAKAPMPTGEALALMQRLLVESRWAVGRHLPRPLHLREIEHSLCETDKMLRAQSGEGRPKQLYRRPA